MNLTRAQKIKRREALQIALIDLTRDYKQMGQVIDAIAKEIEALTVDVAIGPSWTFMEIKECDLANGQPA